MQYSPPDPEKRQGAASGLMPVLGVVMMICMGVIAYFSAPEAIKLARSSGTMTEAEFDSRLQITDIEKIQNTPIHFAFAVMIWLVLFGGLMLIAAIAVGRHPDRERAFIHPRGNDAKALKKYAKELERQKARRDKLMAEKLKREGKK